MTHILKDLGWSDHFARQVDVANTHLTPARIAEIHRDRATALTETGEFSVCSAGKPLTVGDWILTDGHRIEAILDRRTVLSRRAAGTDVRAQFIAANVDTLFIVSSCNPDFKPARLERYLVLAHEAGCFPVIVLTKADLTDDPRAFEREAETLGTGTIALAVNAHDDADIDRVTSWCTPGQTAALVGSSGVGKTTLANAMTGRADTTQNLRDDDAKGRHTTTSRSLKRMTNGGWLIDTPGMRALRLFDASDGIGATFADIEALADGCKFRDCVHETEPGCAVQAAVDDGTLASDRLQRWRKLLREDARNSEAIHEARARDKAFGRMVRDITKDRKDR